MRATETGLWLVGRRNRERRVENGKRKVEKENKITSGESLTRTREAIQ